MVFASPGEILLAIGPLTIRWYGLMTAFAFLVCLYVASKIAESRHKNIEANDLSNFAIVAIITGLIGARTWFVLLNADYFLDHPLESFQIWLGGQSIQGALIGAILGTMIFEFNSKKKDWLNSYIEKLALISIVVPLGQAIGRWGNFFNEEAFGKITNLPWKLYISHTGTYHHPTFLYESLANLVIFFILFNLSKKLKPMQVFLSYIAMYSALRLLIEPLRTDSLMIGNFAAASVTSLVLLMLSLLSLLIYAGDRHLKNCK